MTPSIYTWTPLRHLVTMLLQRQNPLIRELYLKQDQAPQKLIDNSGHMKTIGKCSILLLVTMTPIMITMTQMLTLTSTKNSSKEEMDGTKQVQHLKKKKKRSQKRPKAAQPYPCMSGTLFAHAEALSSNNFVTNQAPTSFNTCQSQARPLSSYAKLIVNCI